MKRYIVFFLKSLAAIISCILLYLVFSIILSMIKIPEKETSEKKTIPIYIYTNGVHTDIVLPTQTDFIDWSEKIPLKNIRSKNKNFPYIAIGWGDKGFYLNTPTWADLKPSTAIIATFWLGETAIHCTYYTSMNESDHCKKIMLTHSQYKDLVKFILNTFDKDENNDFIHIPTDAVYGNTDAFYEAKGNYSFMKTCNTWVNEALKISGQKAALWTPFDKGIFVHYQN